MTDTTRLYWSADPNEPGMYEDPDGDYVYYEDYQALERQKAALVEALLPERLDRDLAEILCEIDCAVPCDMDCDCNPKVQEAWKVLRKRLIARAEGE